MDLRAQVDELFFEEQGYCHWAKLINFFDKHKNELDNKDKKRIFLQAEKYRTEHNEKYPNDPIRREDTNPYIYADLSFLEAKSEEKEVQVPANAVYA